MGQRSMTTETIALTEAGEAYDALAPAYDLLTRGYAYDRWLPALEQLAHDQGLRGSRLLDVACGTGRASCLYVSGATRSPPATSRPRCLPGLARRLQMSFCTSSICASYPRWAASTSSRASMTPSTTCLTSMNSKQRFEASPGTWPPEGIAVWDLNTLAQYRGQFARDHIVADEDMFVAWRGWASGPESPQGALIEITIEIFADDGDGAWRRETSIASSAPLDSRDGRPIEPSRRAGVGRRPRPAPRRRHRARSSNELVHTKAVYSGPAERRA